MKITLRRRKHIGTYAPPWMIVTATCVLLITVLVLAIHNLDREKRYMAQILSEKGAALIRAFEAGARTGMMGMMWGGNQVQNLIEQTARQPDILYLVVTDKTGLVLSDSRPSMIGRRFIDPAALAALNPGQKEKWRLRDYGDRQRSFEVYRYFHPLTSEEIENCGPRMMGNMRNDWCFSSGRSGNEQMIFVGLDVDPFESARREDIKNTVVVSSVLLLLGCGGLFSIFLAQRYRSTRRILQDTTAFADEVVTNLPVGLVATDKHGNIVVFNETAGKITGLKVDDVLGKKSEEVLTSELCGLKPFLEQKETILEREMECAFSDHKLIPVSISAAPIHNEEGNFVGKVIIMKDLGEVRTLQQEVQRREKLAALGSLAAGIAHEIRNPLSSIKGMASFFRNKFPEGSEEQEAASVMAKEADRLNRVISELLEFARPSKLNLKPTDIDEVLEHSLRLIEQDARAKRISINLSKARNLPSALLDPDRLSQCFLNLYINGIQAMEKGGILSVRSSLDSRKLITVEIEDTGQGIDEADLEKIFDPYFTTKPSGTGLGLAIVHKIIEAHDGIIKVRSVPGKGTVFTISIPVRSGGNDVEGYSDS